MSGTWWVAVVQLSESFGASIAALCAELGAGVLSWSPEAGDPAPPSAAALILLAGGAEADALDLMVRLRGLEAPLLVVGANADHRLAAEMVRQGAAEYLVLPEDMEAMRRALERIHAALDARAASLRLADAERRSNGFDAILGTSGALMRTIEQAKRVARHRDVTVLIGGETGTGKELLARALHYESPRAAEPFVEINCAAIPAALLESELFGHEKGAFTGAVQARAGLFELAHGGTLFLDEIGTLPLELQPKLLRALESRTIRRVGGHDTRQVDVRLVAATHMVLRDAVARGEFREDLYYRLNVVELTLPPLRDRDSDVELLAETFVQRLASSYGLPLPPVSPELRAALRSRRWPGNVRELRNAVERALVLSPAGTLRPEEFPAEADGTASADGELPFPATLQEILQAAARAMMTRTAGNRSEAARRLGISRPRLLRLLGGQTDNE
ncbi:MAG TPA: sigma-54 dependent transcriptional regulator [Gemmatimonadales bacterium]|jgi:DNA-binding NtrC family response regulator|nr:sigma-54 dependent transcriptional regulator [Gemmatimonadales bacterium]